MKTSVTFRKFSDLRKTKAVGHKKPTIKPYDSSKLEEKFKKEYMAKITELETAIANVKNDIEQTEDQMAMERLDIDERKARIEDRTIGLVAFSTLVRFYSRFLDTREADAKTKMSDPIDDIKILESVVEKVESTAAEMESLLADEGMDEIESMIAEETRIVEQMENDNLATRCSVEIRQLTLPLLRAETESRQPVPVKPAPVFEPDPAVLNEMDIDARIEASYYDALQQRQEDLRTLEAELNILEEKQTEFLASEAAKWRQKSTILACMRDDLEEAFTLNMEIDRLQKEIDRMKFMELKGSEEENSRQTQIAALRRIQKRIDEKKQELEDLKQKVNDMKVVEKKKNKLLTKRRAKLSDLVKEVETLEEKNEDKMREIERLEQKLLITEMLLNQQLKNAQSMSNYVLPSNVYETKKGLSPRIEEMMKVLELVSVSHAEQ